MMSRRCREDVDVVEKIDVDDDESLLMMSIKFVDDDESFVDVVEKIDVDDLVFLLMMSRRCY